MIVGLSAAVQTDFLYFGMGRWSFNKVQKKSCNIIYENTCLRCEGRCWAVCRNFRAFSAKMRLQEFHRQQNAFLVDAMLKAGTFVQFGPKAVGG